MGTVPDEHIVAPVSPELSDRVPNPTELIITPVTAVTILQKYRPENLEKVKYMIGTISMAL